MTDSRKYSGCLFSIHIYTFKFFEANKAKKLIMKIQEEKFQDLYLRK